MRLIITSFISFICKKHCVFLHVTRLKLDCELLNSTSFIGASLIAKQIVNSIVNPELPNKDKVDTCINTSVDEKTRAYVSISVGLFVISKLQHQCILQKEHEIRQ